MYTKIQNETQHEKTGSINLRNLNFLDLVLSCVAGSNPDEVIGFFSIDLILLAALGPGVYSASNRNEYQELIK
jgi:hypothetical protein